ncbi:Hexuronate transporter [Paraburkholderia caffeinitolerans]|uniref:Hexuronate transporter n=1 Tax=Paraburkholderia caffeinitolerans TaxID=1723730 RepID=A0A6J5G462_9BURK|nr:MFS transporter [Paraburkholderia caffeinitolerans]CAB3793361.1 Hexuronate transporter [Paraburkholderia caffeinitolerans]
MRMHDMEAGQAVAAAQREKLRVYPWVVFALTLGLVMSDYMSRQVLTAVFPLIKAAWHLSDTQLGSLNSVVALLVGTLTLPLSLLAARWGHVKSIFIMAALWSLATLGCAVSTNYGEMLAARALVGIGEAAYGAVAPALLLSVFPVSMRAVLFAAFTAGASFGSVLGLAFGGAIAAHLGWPWSFATMGIFGMVLVIVFRVVVTEARVSRYQSDTAGGATAAPGARATLRSLINGLATSRSLVCAYLGSGLQLFCTASLWAWMPSYLNRYYGMAPGRAAIMAAAFVMLSGIGMITCGLIADRISKTRPARKWDAAFLYCLTVFVLLAIAFRLAPGALQLGLIGVAMFITSGTNGPGGAMVANLTPRAIHASAFALLAITYNLLGTAPGPYFTGFLADRIGLHGALQYMPFVSAISASVFFIGKRSYARDLARIEAQ